MRAATWQFSCCAHWGTTIRENEHMETWICLIFHSTNFQLPIKPGRDDRHSRRVLVLAHISLYSQQYSTASVCLAVARVYCKDIVCLWHLPISLASCVSHYRLPLTGSPIRTFHLSLIPYRRHFTSVQKRPLDQIKMPVHNKVGLFNIPFISWNISSTAFPLLWSTHVAYYNVAGSEVAYNNVAGSFLDQVP